MIQRLLVLLTLHSFHGVNGAGKIVPFVTPGLPACYVALTPYEIISGTSKLCSHGINSRFTCGKNGQEYYFYCSDDHDCCYNDGCPACCTSRKTLNMAETAGIVIACVLFFAIILGVVYLLVGRFCAKRAMS